jgi:hypothetical protein
MSELEMGQSSDLGKLHPSSKHDPLLFTTRVERVRAAKNEEYGELK